MTRRVEELACAWGVVVERALETPGSLVAFGKRGDLPVVMKVIRKPGDEWRTGEVLEAFDGTGIVRAYEHVNGAVLMERLNPGTSLVDMVLNGCDQEATDILAGVMREMSHQQESSNSFVTVQDWGNGFQLYIDSEDEQISRGLVEQAQRIYYDLCKSQKGIRLLHGDLQHYNVLFDSVRGWVAIDPKGVVGEIEYEIGASLRNPCERPDLFAEARIIERRIKRYEEKLKLDSDRVLAWGFAQAVLSAIWSVEDGDAVDSGNAALMLANVIRPMLDT